MKRLKPGTAIIVEHEGKKKRGVVAKYSECFVGSDKMRKKIKKRTSF